MQRTTIALSRTKLVLLLLLSLAFVAIAAWLLTLDATQIATFRRYHYPWLVHGVGGLGIVFFGFAGVVAARKLVDSRPGLVLDERGLTDNASGLAAGFIPWSEISGWHVWEFNRQRVLYVQLVDARKYLGRAGPIKRLLLSANLRMGYGPVGIPATTLAIGFDELVAVFQQHFEAHQSTAGHAR